MPVYMEKPKSADVTERKHINGTSVDFLSTRIGLKHQHSYHLRLMFFNRLYDFADNGPINIGSGGVKSYDLVTEILMILSRNGIITYKHNDLDKTYDIFVTDRYKLELIRSEMLWKSKIKLRRNGPPHPKNIVYYDTKSGEMFCNGLHKRLRGRNKKIFDELFAKSPGYAARGKLMVLARSGKYANDPKMYVLNEAITNLRKVCGVNASVIALDGNGGKLNASCYPLSAQLPHSDF